MTKKASVYLVGAGPGDPELLTLKALRLLETADVVVYDRLVSDEILALIPVGVAKIFVGKTTGHHSLPQHETNELLVSLAKGHRRIVRLKGGDPFLFGRGGEEAVMLAQHQIHFEIVPGITSAMACSAYAGIPLTHRGLADGVHFMTGHRKEDMELAFDQHALADKNCTLAIYMGLANLEPIVSALVNAGRSPSTPVALIEQGTTPQQRTLISSLATITADANSAGITPPAMVVIGEVVTLAKTLDWFVPVAQQTTAEPSQQNGCSSA